MINVFKPNWRLYCCEALGLAIFMTSACFFSAMLEGDTAWHKMLPAASVRLKLTGILMGGTALFIFYAPFTRPSGSHINPAVTLCFLRLGKIGCRDALFYVLFQTAGGTVAVYLMAYLMGNVLTSHPVYYAATIPLQSTIKVLLTEWTIAFIMIAMVLYTSEHRQLKKYTRLFSACFVCVYVIIAGPVSGFGMNPARSLASAIPSQIWTGFWIYALAPIAGMLSATELFLIIKKIKASRSAITCKKAFEIIKD